MFGRGRAHQRPDFLIIGGQRCGTTSLFDALSSHSQMAPPPVRELHYFDLNYHRGARWYGRNFRRRPGMCSGESSPYYLFHPDVPTRVAADLPGVRLIVLLRDPIDRAWSQHQFNVAAGRENLGFLDALSAENERVGAAKVPNRPSRFWPHRDHSYVRRGDYKTQLDRWFEVVDQRSVLLLRSAELYADPRSVHRQVLSHLGLPDEVLETPHRNAGAVSLSAELRKAALPYFQYCIDDDLGGNRRIDYG